MKSLIKLRVFVAILALGIFWNRVDAVNLWVGQTYTWDFSGSILGSTYNMSVYSSGGYLSITGSGFYRDITPTQYFSGTATVTAEWDYTLYYGDTKRHQKLTLSVTCNDNKVQIIPTSVTLSPGETYQLSYRHSYDNQYVGAAKAYYSGGNSKFSVSSSGLITAVAPGEGYVNLYSKVSSESPYCYVKVKEIEPTGVSVNNFSLLADRSIDLNMNVSPSNATVKTSQWYVKSGSDIVNVSGSRLTGVKPGIATIYCMVNGSIRSNDATVTVEEPELSIVSTMPDSNASKISVFANPRVTYSLDLSKGQDFSSISLKESGNNVEGTATISGRNLTFLPEKSLKPLTSYTLSIPRNALLNKWGSPAQNDAVLTFETGDLEKIVVQTLPASESYLTKADRITLKATPEDAVIFYTLDGTDPNQNSPTYNAPIAISEDMTLKAFAVRDGYHDSEIVSALYYKSQTEIEGYHPNETEPFFNYSGLAPHLILSGPMVQSNNFRRISLKEKDGSSVAGQPYLTNDMVVFVPDEPLENCKTYTMDIPRDAIKTSNGEVFRGFNWSFTTPEMTVDVAMRGDESVYLLTENGQLKSRGMVYDKITPEYGSYTFKDYDNLTVTDSDVDDISCGFTHQLIRKGTSLVSGGLAYCGETANSTSLQKLTNAKILKAGFQTSAVIDAENSLWMAGRNDFYQLGDSTGSVAKEFKKVRDNVLDVALGNGYTLFIDNDNVLWGVGRNHRGQLGDSTVIDRKTPIKILDGAAKVYASTNGYFSACLTIDNELLTWGDNGCNQLGRTATDYSTAPEKVMDGVEIVALGEAHALAITDKCELYAWGSNDCGQIPSEKKNIASPTLIAEKIRSTVAGPHTTLILRLSGKVEGWGLLTHSNFESGEGYATGFVVDEGLEFSVLDRVKLYPSRFEIRPDEVFALASLPVPVSADYDEVEWKSSNPDIVTVEGNGIIHTHELGESIVTVTFIDRFGVRKEASASIICTNNPDNAYVASVGDESSDWTVRTQDQSIIIENAEPGTVFFLYNIQGIQIKQMTSKDSQLEIMVNPAEPYIVKSGSNAVKVICQ